MLSMLIILAAFQSGQCLNPTFNGACDVANNCSYHPSPASGCQQRVGGCNNCYRGINDPPPEEGGNRVATSYPFNPSTQWAGYFTKEKSPRFVVSIAGVLGKIGVTEGMIIARINGWKTTPRRMRNLWHRKHAPMRITFYEAGKYSTTLRTVTLRP
jgi:hypothetical protein